MCKLIEVASSSRSECRLAQQPFAVDSAASQALNSQLKGPLYTILYTEQEVE